MTLQKDKRFWISIDIVCLSFDFSFIEIMYEDRSFCLIIKVVFFYIKNVNIIRLKHQEYDGWSSLKHSDELHICSAGKFTHESL